MIDEADAKRRAEAFLKCPSDDPEHPWTMESFEQGWLVRQGPLEGVRGQPCYVVEREAGRIMGFGSGVLPRRILSDYPAVLDQGIVVQPS